MTFHYLISTEERESLSKAIERLNSIISADQIPWEPNQNDIHRQQAREVLATLNSITPAIASFPGGVA